MAFNIFNGVKIVRPAAYDFTFKPVQIYSIHISNMDPRRGAYDLIRLLDRFGQIKIHKAVGSKIPITTRAYMKVPVNMDIGAGYANALTIDYSVD